MAADSNDRDDSGHNSDWGHGEDDVVQGRCTLTEILLGHRVTKQSKKRTQVSEEIVGEIGEAIGFRANESEGHKDQEPVLGHGENVDEVRSECLRNLDDNFALWKRQKSESLPYNIAFNTQR